MRSCAALSQVAMLVFVCMNLIVDSLISALAQRCVHVCVHRNPHLFQLLTAEPGTTTSRPASLYFTAHVCLK